MKIVPVIPPIQHMAVLKVVGSLWRRYYSTKSPFEERSMQMRPPCEDIHEWEAVIQEVKDLVKRLYMPDLLKKKIADCVEPIGLEIDTWQDYHKYFVSPEFIRKSCAKIVLTSVGTVNVQETAEAIVQDDKMDIIERYKMACIYCLENYIPNLWEKLPIRGKKCFYSEKNIMEIDQNKLVVLWSYEMKGELYKFGRMTRMQHKISPYQYAFEYAIKHGNTVATKYFLQKITPREREMCLVEITEYVGIRCHPVPMQRICCSEYYPHLLCFLLSVMTDEQQNMVFSKCSCEVLLSLLKWPWQHMFLTVASHMWNYLPARFYNYILFHIACLCMRRNKEWDYQRLFGKFWELSPETHKKEALDRCLTGETAFLSSLCEMNDAKNIRLVLRYATPELKFQLMLSNWGQHLLDCENWEMLYLFLKESAKTNDDLTKFRLTHADYLANKKNSWEQMSNIVDSLMEVEPPLISSEEPQKSLEDPQKSSDESQMSSEVSQMSLEEPPTSMEVSQIVVEEPLMSSDESPMILDEPAPPPTKKMKSE